MKRLGEISDISALPNCPFGCVGHYEGSKKTRVLAARMTKHSDVYYCASCGSIFSDRMKFISGWKDKAVERNFIPKTEAHIDDNTLSTNCPNGNNIAMVYNGGLNAYCDCWYCEGRHYTLANGRCFNL